MKIIFLGSPGVGKGTYASKIKEHFNIPSISTGDMLRSAVKHGTDTGIKAREYMDKGQLVPDEVVMDLIKERIIEEDCKEGFILDGFPRTISQAEMLEGNEIKINKVINFKAPKNVIIQRLSGRRVCKRCGAIFHMTNKQPQVHNICDRCKGDLYQREDDKPEAISERLIVYNKQTAPLIKYYNKKELLQEIDARENNMQKIIDKTISVLESSDQ